jgi:signal peptidase II
VQTETQEHQITEAPKGFSRTAVLWLGGIAAFALALDAVTKEIATKLLDPDEPVKLIGGALYLSLTRNAGAAFSLFRDFTMIFPIIAIGVAIWIGFMARTLRSVPWAVALGLILGGAMGNLTDRIFRAPGPFKGHVVDFFSLFDPHGQVFPIFNVADMALTFGVILAVLLEVLGRQRDGTRLRGRDAKNG